MNTFFAEILKKFAPRHMMAIELGYKALAALEAALKAAADKARQDQVDEAEASQAAFLADVASKAATQANIKNTNQIKAALKTIGIDLPVALANSAELSDELRKAHARAEELADNAQKRAETLKGEIDELEQAITLLS